MRNYYLTLLLICICGLCFAQQQTNDTVTKNPPNKEWNFNNLDGWKYGHPENGEQLCRADAGAAFQRRRHQDPAGAGAAIREILYRTAADAVRQ